VQVSIHAVEESAIEAACAAIEAALSAKPHSDHRDRLEHAFLCPPHLSHRLAALGIHVVTQPGFLFDNGDRYIQTVPAEKHADLYPIGSFMKAGVAVAAGSDSPVGPLNPFAGIYAALSRKTRTGTQINLQERVSLPNALALYTCNAARAAFEEAVKGDITPGKTADLILLNGDLLRSDDEVVLDMKVDMTILDGKVVWVRESGCRLAAENT
jgi:predicted amidohydrolase YtcJ